MTGKTFTELVTEIITEAIDKYKFSSVNVINEVVSLVNNSSNTL
jgi:hypothetical protein